MSIHQFNPGEKTWKIYAHNIIARDVDDLILEVSGNKKIYFKEGNNTYSIADLSNITTSNSNSNSNLNNYSDVSFGTIELSGNLDICYGNINLGQEQEIVLFNNSKIVAEDDGELEIYSLNEIAFKVDDNMILKLNENKCIFYKTIELFQNLDILYGNLSVAGNVNVVGNVNSNTSDERLKEKLGKIENAVEKVCAIETFYYKENKLAESLGLKNKKKQIGVSAQSVESVLPECVTLAPIDISLNNEGSPISKSGENYKTVDYARIVTLLIAAIKEQNETINELKKEIKSLSILNFYK